MTGRQVALQPPPARGRIGLVLIVAGIAAAMALLAWPGEDVVLEVKPVRVEAPFVQPLFVPEPPRGAAGDAVAIPGPRPAPAVVAATEARARPASIDFKVFGTSGEGSAPAVLLYGGGRTLRVRGPGPIDDEYVVDAIQDGLLVLRFVPSGSTQVLDLASRQPAAMPGWSADDSPQD